MMNPKPTKIERLREFQACPLHGILRGVDCIFTAGCRFVANVWKYRNQRDPITEDEQSEIDDAATIIEAELASVGLFYNRIREDHGGSYNDG